MDLLESLREDHRSFAGSLGRLEALVPEGKEPEPREAEEAREVLRAMQPRFRRHEALEHKYLFPELRGWNPHLDIVVNRDDAEHAEIARELKACEGLLGGSPGDDEVDEWDAESFPSSDAPSWTLGRERSRAAAGAAAMVRKLAALMRRHLRAEDALIYPMAIQRIPVRRRAEIDERAFEEEFKDFIDKGGGD